MNNIRSKFKLDNDLALESELKLYLKMALFNFINNPESLNLMSRIGYQIITAKTKAAMEEKSIKQKIYEANLGF